MGGSIAENASVSDVRFEVGLVKSSGELRLWGCLSRDEKRSVLMYWSDCRVYRVMLMGWVFRDDARLTLYSRSTDTFNIALPELMSKERYVTMRRAGGLVLSD